MLTWLIEQSLRYRLLVVSMTLGVVLAGTLSLEQAKLDVFPEFAPPKIEVQRLPDSQRRKSNVLSPSPLRAP